MSFNADFGGSLAVYTGDALDSLTETDSDYDGTSLSVSFDAVRHDLLRSGRKLLRPTGPFTLSWKLPPANDDFVDAAEFNGNAGSLDGSNVAATLQPPG